MPWAGNGTFNRIYSWVADAAAGINIIAQRVDTDTDDIAANGFGNCLTRDGQGGATANLPMGGFRHTGVGPAADPTDYVQLLQLQTPASAEALGIRFAYVGEIRSTSIRPSLLAAQMPGWALCDGSTRPRTDPLWLAVSAAWDWGNGNGTTTYTLPDLRGRSVFGQDNMGGVAANRVSTAGSGVDGATLGASGGSQLLQQHGHAVPIVDAGHTHGITDGGHTHTYDRFTQLVGATGTVLGAAATAANTGDYIGTNTGNSTTGIAGANINTTGITASASNSGAGASQNMPPAAIVVYVIYTGAA